MKKIEICFVIAGMVTLFWVFALDKSPANYAENKYSELPGKLIPDSTFVTAYPGNVDSLNQQIKTTKIMKPMDGDVIRAEKMDIDTIHNLYRIYFVLRDSSISVNDYIRHKTTKK